VLTYSSLEAFLAHYRTLRNAASLRAEERDLLAAMERAIGVLAPADRTALALTGPEPAIARRRQRAERSLRHVLVEQGLLQG
jgi:hypothetical protein